ncbi:MAG: MipA/OmpV family protein [Duganella sp.]
MTAYTVSPPCRFAPGLSLGAALAACLLWNPAWAQSSETGASRWSLGIGAVALDRIYRDVERDTMALPLVSYENEWISASVPTFDVKLLKGESLSLRLRARWAGDGYEADDAPILAGMEKRKSSLWAGSALIWKTDVANLSAEVLADAMDNSKGMRAKLQIDRRFGFGKFGLTPRLGAEWVDDKFVDYYYGVRRAEVRSGRAFYEGKATTSALAGVRLDYSPARHHTVFVDVGATRYGSSVKDSPLVGKASQTAVVLGYAYRF